MNGDLSRQVRLGVTMLGGFGLLSGLLSLLDPGSGYLGGILTAGCLVLILVILGFVVWIVDDWYQGRKNS